MRDRRLKFSVALKDPDLASLRVRPEFAELSVELLGRGDVAAQVALRTEAKNPFRLLRLFVFGGVAMGSGIGAVVLGGRLAKALAGGDGAPGLVESGGNLAVNLGVGAACVALLLRELDQKQKQESVAAREEELGRLMVALGGGREAALAAMRGSYRPVVVAGSVGHLKGVLRAAEPYKRELQKRGVLVVPVPEGDDALARKKGFSPDASAPGADSPFRPEDRWRVAPVDGERWARWVGAQKQVASLGEEEPIYIAVAADGTVRRSGQGAPRWEDIVEDFPELDSPAAKLTGL